MAGLVGGLDVDADDVVVLHRLDRGAALRGVVGIEITRRAGDVDPRPARQHADSADQVHGRDHRPLLAVQLGKRRQARGLALSPEPDGVGRSLTGSRLEPG